MRTLLCFTNSAISLAYINFVFFHVIFFFQLLLHHIIFFSNTITKALLVLKLHYGPQLWNVRGKICIIPYQIRKKKDIFSYQQWLLIAKSKLNLGFNKYWNSTILGGWYNRICQYGLKVWEKNERERDLISNVK